MSSNQLTKLIQEEVALRNRKAKALHETSNRSNRFNRFSKFRNKLNETDIIESKANFGVFTYWVEGDEPEMEYFTSKGEAIRYAKGLVNGFEMNYIEGDGLPDSIEVWQQDIDGSWGNTGSPLYEHYFDIDDMNEASNRFSKSKRKLNEAEEESDFMDGEGATKYVTAHLKKFCKSNPLDLNDIVLSALNKQLGSLSLDENLPRYYNTDEGFYDKLELGNINPTNFGVFSDIITQLKITADIFASNTKSPYISMELNYSYEHPSGGRNARTLRCLFYNNKWSLRN